MNDEKRPGNKARIVARWWFGWDGKKWVAKFEQRELLGSLVLMKGQTKKRDNGVYKVGSKNPHSTRLTVLDAITYGTPISRGEIVKKTGVSYQSVRNHLKVLRHKGLIEMVGARAGAKWQKVKP